MPTDYLIKINDMIDEISHASHSNCKARAKRFERDLFIKVLSDIALEKTPCSASHAASLALRVLDCKVHQEPIDYDTPRPYGTV